LSKRHDVYVATNKPSLPTRKILKHSGIFDLLKRSYSLGYMDSCNKIELVARLLEENPGESILIGDSGDDLMAATGNRIDFIYCSYRYGAIEASEVNNKRAIRDLQELTLLLN